MHGVRSTTGLLTFSVVFLFAAALAVPAWAGANGGGEQGEKHADRNDGEKKAGSDKADDGEKWIKLFDGKPPLENWKKTVFGGEGPVEVKDGAIILGFGTPLTGITWKGEPPARINYEIQLDAKRIDGTDFFCGLTLPVKDEAASLIVGGWGGGLVGISSVNGYDASENSTSSWMTVENGKWYHIRVRVTEPQIEAWIEGEKVVDLLLKDKKMSVRPEVLPSVPLGIASFQTVAGLKNIRLRRVDGPEDPVEQ